ncbi:MAG: hypothetical protein P4L73_14460 [Caulobacteraceae bacterium]|nr:hypothetical protein [Caulobacteraceae bacterium]
MGKALELSTSPGLAPVSSPLCATSELLAQGGDARLTLDPATGLNKYGCPPAPVTSRLDFASSTASVISKAAFAEADALRDRLARSAVPAAAAYALELDRLRGELVALKGLFGLSGLEIAFAASGTDLHLMVAELVGGEPAHPLTCLAVEAEETGSGVPQALCGRHFSDRAALGAAVAPGAAVGAAASTFVAVPARDAAGELRDGAEIEAELDALVLEASEAGRRVLLTVADVSKTGLIAPGLSAVMALRRRFPRTLEVLVDACQFRLAPATLRAYLEAGLMVAVTGSKFLTGPTFSGALFVPAAAGERLRARLLKPGFALYSARAEWPAGWVAGAALPDAANFGLLLRWRAAVAELAAFRALPEARVAGFLSAFADAVEARLAVDPQLEPVATRPLDRRAIGAAGGWDAVPTIFPFRLRAAPGAGFLSLAETEAVYRALRDAGVRLGQPVACGAPDGAPVSALRLCASARLAVEALGEGGAGAEAVIARALDALDAAVEAARA